MVLVSMLNDIPSMALTKGVEGTTGQSVASKDAAYRDFKDDFRLIM